jgi:hypothetical protein
MELCLTQALESHYSTHPRTFNPKSSLEVVVHSSSGFTAPRRASFDRRPGEPGAVFCASRRIAAALVCAFAIFSAGCHRNNLTSGYGNVWLTLTDDPGDFTSYIVNVDSITLTRNDGAVVTALATAETVDFAKLNNYAELWGTAVVPIGTYLSATIVIDYTSAYIATMFDGLPRAVNVRDFAGSTVTTETVNVIFDPQNPLVVAPTYATTAAVRLALDFNLGATPPIGVKEPVAADTVFVNPYVTAAIAPADNKPIRIRGPLINSNVPVGTYTVYVRPFYDEANNLGQLTLFTDANTVFTTNGTASLGTTGLTQLSQSSAGSTVTAAFATYQPTPTPSATAGIFHALYVVAGSTLEDVYTQGLEGDVIARNGNTLTLQGSTLFLNDGVSFYNEDNAQVLLSANTIVTADGTTLPGLDYNSVAVGQHIIARGICTGSANCGYSGTTVTLDATGDSSTNTGSVRLISTDLWGSIVSTGSGSVNLALQTINNWPVSDYNFSGNGASAATTPVAADFPVNTGTIALPVTTPGDPLWINGLFAPFGSAPPAFTASAVNSEASVQMAGQAAGSTMSLTNPTPGSCAQGNFDCIPATMHAQWQYNGSTTPFSPLTYTGMTLDLSNPALLSAVIRIGPEIIDMKSLPASPPISPIYPNGPPPPDYVTSPAAGSVQVVLPPIFLPNYTFGNPAAVAPAGIKEFSYFSTFAGGLAATLPSSPAYEFLARGTYNRTNNTFTALSVDVVLL